MPRNFSFGQSDIGGPHESKYSEKKPALDIYCGFSPVDQHVNFTIPIYIQLDKLFLLHNIFVIGIPTSNLEYIFDNIFKTSSQ